MKIALSMILATMASASAAKSVSGHAAAKILRAARRAEEADEAEEDEFAYLMNYSLKLVSCKAGETVINGENGEYEYNAAILRLCPNDGSCVDESTNGCSSAYGDLVVGLNTFVEAYFEDQRDNMNWDDQFEVDKFTECREYDVEDDDGNQNNNQNVQYFIGPACTEDGADVRLALFYDETCSTESDTAFEDISNGWSLPYSDGGLVSTSCQPCSEYNDDGEYELKELCMETYEQASAKCEDKMEYYSYYGQNVQGCEYVESLMPAKATKGSGGKVFGWIVFVLVVVGIAAYVVWWRKRKSGTDIMS